MLRTLTIIALLFSGAVGARADTLTLHHVYTVAGTNLDGSPYGGTAKVDVISGATFAITWTIGKSVQKGFGMRMNNFLSATYTLNGQPGLVMYEVGDNDTLDGIWALRGDPGNGTERLTPAD